MRIVLALTAGVISLGAGSTNTKEQRPWRRHAIEHDEGGLRLVAVVLGGASENQRAWVSTYPVTVGQFERFVGATGYQTEATRGRRGGFRHQAGVIGARRVVGCDWRWPGFEQRVDYPALNITRRDAEAFCAWLSQRVGQRYFLWDRATRPMADAADRAVVRRAGDFWFAYVRREHPLLNQALGGGLYSWGASRPSKTAADADWADAALARRAIPSWSAPEDGLPPDGFRVARMAD